MPKLLEQVRTVIRLRHYSLRTEQSYVNWIKQYILARMPIVFTPEEVRAVLSHLTCPTRWLENIRMPAEIGVGSMCSLQRSSAMTRSQERNADIT